MTTTEVTIINSINNSSIWFEAAQLWLEAVERRRGSKRSRVEYQRTLTAFFKWAAKAPDQVSATDCQRWASTMTEAGLAGSTIKARLAAVSSFYIFVSTRYEVEPGRYLHNFNPVSAVQRPHVNPYEKAKGLSPDQVKAILKACDRSSVKGARDYALLLFYLFTARRRAEVARLKWGDLREGSRLGAMEYHYQGKGGKGGWRELPPPVWEAIRTYLAQSARLSTMAADTPLFIPMHDKASYLGHTLANNRGLSERAINQVIDTASKRAGLEHVSVHTLRHASAKLRRAAGEDLESISHFLDHSSLAVTSIYLNSLEAKEDTRWREVSALIGL